MVPHQCSDRGSSVGCSPYLTTAGDVVGAAGDVLMTAGDAVGAAGDILPTAGDGGTHVTHLDGSSVVSCGCTDCVGAG